ncbi:Regulatory protein RecX [uncultured Paludibacter sp.]|uniref:Regulatory protein RecX n=1 Tax=uncultured Paludibacter sp. TaxID=497635 RepID=A0A653AKB4_9BACT|nr:Regulatory protein RecX [uncultured Paludibacter sp.]
MCIRILKSLVDMKKEYTFDELLHKAASYCSISEHCISDVEEKLKAWGVNPADSEKIIQHLIKQDFINEKRYSRAFVRDKFGMNKWGKIKISLAMREKGIDKEMIADALKVIDDGEYEEQLARLLKNKLHTINYEFEYEKQGKLFRFAQSRGFENNVIERVLRRI